MEPSGSGSKSSTSQGTEKERFRVLMVISLFYPTIGGAENQALRQAMTLARRGHQVSVLTLARRGPPKAEEIHGIRVHRKIKTLALGPLWGLSFMLSCAWFFYRFRRDYDIIHCHQIYFHTVAAVLAARWLKKTVVVKVVNTGTENDARRFRRHAFGATLLRVIRGVDAVFCLCEAHRRELREEGFAAERLIDLPNGVDTRRFSPAEAMSDTSNRRVLYIGRFVPTKTVDVLVRAMVHVIDREPLATLTLVGEGDQISKLVRLAEELEISTNLSFLPPTDNVLDLYRGSECVVMPSRAEGLSNVMLEAMACARAVVATPVGGNPDLACPPEGWRELLKSKRENVVVGQNAVLVVPDDPEALAEGIVYVLMDSDLRRSLGARARAFVCDNHDLEKIADRLEEVYGRLARGEKERRLP